MFDLRTFVKRGFLKAIGHQPDYFIIQNSVGWHDKGMLTMEDLKEIQDALDANSVSAE